MQSNPKLQECSVIWSFITYQAYTAYSKELLNKNCLFTAKTGSVLYSG